MERVIYDYKVIHGDSVSELDRQVREYVQLQKGWEPHGSLLKDGATFYQPIVRVKDED